MIYNFIPHEDDGPISSTFLPQLNDKIEAFEAMYGTRPQIISMSDGCLQVFKYNKINVTDLLGDSPSDLALTWRGILVEGGQHNGIQLIGDIDGLS